MNYNEYRKLKKADPLSSPVSTSKKSKSAEETKPRMTYSEYRQQQKSITNPIALVQTKPAQPIMQDVTPVAPSKEFELKYSKYFVPDTKIGNPTSTSKINLPVNDVALNKDEQDWLNDKKKVSNAKAMEQSRIEAEQMAEQNPLLGSAVSVFGNAAGSAVAPIATIGTKLTGKEIDPNSPAYRLIQQANAARQGTKTGVKNALGVQDGTFAQKAVDFGVDTGLSMAETVVRSLFMSPVAGATQAGLSAASRRLVEAKQNGADDSRALASAVAQGVAEEFFEKFSLEGLRAFRTNPATGFKAVLKNIAKQSFTEGSEEFFTDWANAISDYFIMGGDSEWKQSYNNYLAQGMSEEEAIRRTFVDTLEQSALSFLGGAVSGGVLGGGVSVMNLGNNARVGSEMNLTEESLNDMAESVDTEKENYTNRNAYKTAVETQQMYQELARRVANGETLSNAEKGATLEAAMNLAAEASGNHVEKTEVSSLDSSIDAVNRAENTFKRAESSENVQNVPSIGQRAASFPESVRDTYINGFNDNINSNDDIVTYDENMRKVYEAGLRGDPIASLSDDTSFMDFYNSSESAADSVDAMWIKGAEMRLQNSRSASTIDTNTEVNNNGRQTGTNLSDEGGIRPLSQRTREQSEGIRRATEEVRGIWKSTGSPADGERETQRFLRKERAEQIIPVAKTGTYLYIPENKTKSMVQAESSANEYGLKVVSWGGGVATSKDGKQFRGMTIPGTDTIYAQVDNNEFSQDKLVRHEIAENKLTRNDFTEIFNEASEKSEAVTIAAELYQAFSGDEFENAAKELICDSNGLMNQFKLLAESNPEYQEYADVLETAINTINPIVSARLEGKKQTFNRNATTIETNAATERKLKAAGIAIDHETNSVFSYSTWNRSQYVEDPVTAAKELSKALGISQKKARAFIDDISCIAKMIASDKDKLAYTESGLSPFVSNSEYGGSFDFDTSCTKRRVFAGTFTAIQNALPNTALTSEEVLQIRKMMDDAGFEVPCGKCYVEGSRASMGQFTKRFIELYKKYYPNNWQPNMAQANTPDGIEWIRLTHPECYQQYEYFWNHYGTLRPGDPNLFASQQNPKLYMAHSAYSDEILTEFKNSTNVIDKNRNGGIRFQSFSDFEIIHAIDAMQAIMDMSRVGLAGQAYTKQPNFVRAFGNTGMKINLSIDAWSVDENGNLTFNNKEGMPFETAMELRDKFSKNVGTICCVYDDKMLLAALADDRIDFIIPFHRSQWKKAQYKAMGLPHTTKDYTNQQNEKWLNPKDHTHEYRGRQVPTKCTNYMPNDYWDFSKSGKENAEIYLQKCFEDGKRPKFYKFLDRNSDGSFSLKKDGSTDGYWKLLIDFKMYDNNGVGSPQMPVRPNFEMDAINQMLTEYEGGHQNYPVAQGIVDEFVDSYKKSHAGAQFSSSITAGMTDEERYNILKDKTINIVESVPAKITNDYKEALSKANTSALARKLFVKLATDFDLKKEYSNSDINLKFNFSRNDVEESVTKQNKNNISDLMLLFTCLDDVVSNAVGIEVHNRNDIGYKKNEHLMAMYVLAGAFSDGDRIIPVKLEVKEFDTNPNSLYVAIALESIKKDDIFGSSTDETSASNPPSSTYKLADLFKNINASDRSFVKYIPIQFRTQENSSSLTAGLSSDEIRSRLDNIKELNSVGSMGYPHASEWQATRVGDNKEPMRLSDINKMIEQQLGINVTVGQIRKQGVRGNYNNVSHGIRTRVAMDLPTISHEVGHWFDYKYGKISQQKLTTEVQNELKAALGSLAGSYPARLHYVEGTAEFFRKYLTNSVEATNKYPNATKYFLGSLSPRDLAIVTNLANEVNAYYALGADNAQSAIRLREDGGMDFRTIREKMKDRWDGFYQKWVSSNQAIRNLDKATGGNAYIKATNAAYADAIAANIIEGNLTDIHGQYVGPGLGAALEGVNIKNKKEYLAFNEYLVCKHGSEWLADGKRVFADDRMNTTAFMNKRVSELDKQYPQFKAAQARLVQFIKDFNQTWGVNTGLVDQKLYDALNKKYPNYVPFYRALEKGGSRGAKSGFANQMNPYRRAKGSGLDIIAPVDNVFEQIATMVNAAIRNDVMLSVRNAAQNLGAEATFLEKVAAPMVPKQFDTNAIKNALSRDIDIELNKNGVNMDIIDDINAVIDSLQDTITQFNQGKATGNIVSVLVKGKKEFYKINDPMLLESLTHMTSAKRNGILGAFATITRFMTANITGNNVIWGIFSNAPRDWETFAVYSKNKNPMKAFSGFAEAYKNSVKDFFDKDVSPLYSEYLAMGGGHSSVYANDRNLAKDARKALVDKSGGNRLTNRLTALAKRLANPINWASMLTDTIEMGPRFATYKMCREMGMNPETAFYEAMDITVNFRRGGVYSKEIGKYLPFFNAAVQGLDKYGRYFSAEDIANPKRRAKVAATRFTTFVAVSALVGMLQWLINSRNDEDKKNYAQLSTFIKNSYFPIPLGDGKYFVIPKSRELGSTASAFANAFEMYVNGNKHAFDDFYTYAADNFLPDVASQIAEFPFNVKHDGLSEALGDLSAGILGAPFFGPFVDIRMNRDFLGRPIISSSFSYKSVEPRDVFTDNTSKIAYWIGQGLNYEPVKIDYLGNNILGYIWKYPSALIGNVGGERDLSLGVKNSYIKDNLYSQDLTNWMYDQREKSERAFNSDEDSIDKKIVADLDDDMTSFYSNFNKLNKANTNQSEKRTNKQLVMDMIAGYRAYKDGGTNPSLEAVKDVIRDYAESGTSVSDAAKLLPDVMEVTVKSQYKDSKNKTVKDEYSLTDKQYYDFQADYNAQYYSFIEQNLKMSDPLEKKVGVIEAAKEAAKNNATLNMLKKLGARTDAKMTDVETVRTKAQEKAAKAVFEEAYNSAKENDADGHFSSQEMYQLATDFAKKNSGYNAEELYLSKAGNAKKTYYKYTAAGGTWDDFDDYLEMQSLSGEDKQEKIMDYLQNSNWSESTRKKLWEIAYKSEYGTKKAEYGY